MIQSYETCIQSAKAELTDAKLIIQHEITTYPGPISGCDAQFNHLLAERHKIQSALRALEEAVFVPTPRAPHPQAGIESR